MSRGILAPAFRSAVIHTLSVAALFALTASTVFGQVVSRPRPHADAEKAKTTTAIIDGRAPTIIPLIGADLRRDTLLWAGVGPARPASVALARKVAQEAGEWKRSIDYSGPRFGVTYLPQAAVDSLKNHNIDVGQTITQFGWQLENEVHVSPQGPMVLNEWVFLAGGLERGVFLPSVTWLIGARGNSGNEVGFGPNVSVAGVGLAAAAGVTMTSGGLHFPMNVAAASSKGGVRVSFLTGFTLH